VDIAVSNLDIIFGVHRVQSTSLFGICRPQLQTRNLQVQACRLVLRPQLTRYSRGDLARSFKQISPDNFPNWSFRSSRLFTTNPRFDGLEHSRGFGKDHPHPIFIDDWVIRLLHAHYRAISVLFHIFGLTLDLGWTDLAHLVAVIRQLETGVCILKPLQLCLANEVQECIPNAVSSLEIDWKVKEIVSPTEAALIKVRKQHVTAILARNVSKHDGGDGLSECRSRLHWLCHLHRSHHWHHRCGCCRWGHYLAWLSRLHHQVLLHLLRHHVYIAHLS